MKKSIILFLAIIFFSCEKEKRAVWVCDCTQKEKVANFITNNLKNANNMSDEEMEDVIVELTNTSVKVNCMQELLYVDYNGLIDWNLNTIDSSKTYYIIYF